MKIMNISLGGKDLVLNYEAIYFYEYFLEYTGVDIFKESQKPMDEENEMVKMLDSSTGYFKFVTGLVAAGYHSECSLKEVEPEFDIKKIKHFISSKNINEVREILDAYNSMMFKGNQKNGEEKKKKSQSNQLATTN